LNYLIEVPFTIPYSGLAFISEKPQISWQDKKLHNENDKAVKYPDGYGFYFLYGVCLNEKLFKGLTDRTINSKEIISIENIEQRMAALKYYGMEKLLTEVSAKLIDDVSGYRLYKIDKLFSQTAYFLNYKCTSTGREYATGIDPKVGEKSDALLACAWKWGLAKDEYRLEKES